MSQLPEESRSQSPPSKPSRAWGWWLLVIAAIGIGVFFVVRKRSGEKSAAGSPASGPGGGKPTTGGRGGFGGPIVVGVAQAKAGDIGVYVNALGSVTPLSTVAVRSRVEGQLLKVNYTEGSMVKEGDELAEIDPAQYQAALAQAEGQLARDSASLENAKLDSQRYKDAFARNAVPRQQLDTQLSAVRQFEGAVKFDQGQVDNAKVQLAYCHIRAPITGRVGLRLVDPGNIVRANDTNPLVVITQLKPIAVVFSVAEDYLPQIQKQLRAGNKLTVDALDRAQVKRIASGVLQTVDNQIDANTGTVKLKAVFTNDDEALFPNQFVNARLLVETHRNVTLVPSRAIQRGSQGAFVFVVKEDQTVAAQPVMLGPTENEMTEADGLQAGTTIAMDNFNRLSNGAKIMVRPNGGGPGGPPGVGQREPGGTNVGGWNRGGTNANSARERKGAD